jgi:hypothetical protein
MSKFEMTRNFWRRRNFIKINIKKSKTKIKKGLEIEVAVRT